eukprot:TRINITY_DN10463_c0_g1_i1.p1 TRINITY_DN10463_c0_g1~~TRINITY_DN10463_c0_g1_i1.p1  ORF type:complete len:477 (+),score=78.10 TRINITY_DN10463_c0_g1_i1:107-1432(+)
MEKVPALNEPVESVIVEDIKKSKTHSDMDLFANRPSLLSSEASANSYRGFLNLMTIVLVTTNMRLIVENILKYGFLVNINRYYIEEWYRWPAFAIGLVLFSFFLLGYALQLLAASRKLKEETCQKLIIGNIVLLICVPTVLVWIVKPNPASGMALMCFVVAWGMKAVSYAHVNHNLRSEFGKGKTDNGWPANLKLRNILYFLAIPTLCYRLHWPRAPKIRWGFLFRRIFEGLFLSILLLAIVEQYIIPLVNSSFKGNEPFDILIFTERLLKLSVPNLYVWLLGFYIFFHIYLNVLAEITLFGDRLFYRDWWNSTSLAYYWRTWNMPVHAFMLVHVYTPVLNRGYSKASAYLACFFVSAAFHEVVVAVPFQMVKMWSFMGIMAQIPLIQMTSGLRGGQIGNVIFWFSIVLGQPFLVLMMYRAWHDKHFGGHVNPMEVDMTFV